MQHANWPSRDGRSVSILGDVHEAEPLGRAVAVPDFTGFTDIDLGYANALMALLHRYGGYHPCGDRDAPHDQSASLSACGIASAKTHGEEGVGVVVGCYRPLLICAAGRRCSHLTCFLPDRFVPACPPAACPPPCLCALCSQNAGVRKVCRL